MAKEWKSWDKMTTAEQQALLAELDKNEDVIYVGSTSDLEEVDEQNCGRRYADTVLDNTYINILIPAIWEGLDIKGKAYVVALLCTVFKRQKDIANRLRIDRDMVRYYFNYFLRMANGLQENCKTKVSQIRTASTEASL